MKKNKVIMLSFMMIVTTNIMVTNAETIHPPHGYINYPPSRAFLCSAMGGHLNRDCGVVQYEPQSIEGLKGFPSAGPVDGHIASAGNQAFNQLDKQNETRWHRTHLMSGKNKFTWRLTAAHKTTSWQFFITQPKWDINKPLTRSALDLIPFCERNDDGKIPQKNIEIECNIPERQGYHLILGVWNIADTKNAFYQVIDVNIN